MGFIGYSLYENNKDRIYIENKCSFRRVAVFNSLKIRKYISSCHKSCKHMKPNAFRDFKDFCLKSNIKIVNYGYANDSPEKHCMFCIDESRVFIKCVSKLKTQRPC